MIAFAAIFQLVRKVPSLGGEARGRGDLPSVSLVLHAAAIQSATASRKPRSSQRQALSAGRQEDSGALAETQPTCHCH